MIGAVHGTRVYAQPTSSTASPMNLISFQGKQKLRADQAQQELTPTCLRLLEVSDKNTENKLAKCRIAATQGGSTKSHRSYDPSGDQMTRYKEQMMRTDTNSPAQYS
jgi:hypothetical protein